MTTLALRADDRPAFRLHSWTYPGFSEEADKVTHLVRNIFGALTSSASGNKRFAEPFQSLDEIAQKCKFADWDNEGAEPITRDAVSEARALLLSLPDSVKMPDIFPEATGSIAFEWYHAPGYRYVITMSGIRVVEFAGLFGHGNEIYGEFRIDGGFPKAVRDHLGYLHT